MVNHTPRAAKENVILLGLVEAHGFREESSVEPEAAETGEASAIKRSLMMVIVFLIALILHHWIHGWMHCSRWKVCSGVHQSVGQPLRNTLKKGTCLEPSTGLCRCWVFLADIGFSKLAT
jgi:hypothetical protein